MVKVLKKNLIFAISFVVIAWVFYYLLRPVEIVAVHQDGNYSHVLVNYFPITDKAKINWWLKNSKVLEKLYKIPRPAKYGNYTIIFWDFGKGYTEEGKYDGFCFDDMKSSKNCIEKKPVFSVDYSENKGVVFTLYDGYYKLGDGNEIKKIN